MTEAETQAFHGKRVAERQRVNNTPFCGELHGKPCIAQPEGELVHAAPADYWMDHAPDAFTEAEISQGIAADMAARKLGMGFEELAAAFPRSGSALATNNRGKVVSGFVDPPADFDPDLGLKQLSAAADEGRLAPSPSFKRADHKPTGWPPIYFDGVRAGIALDQIISEARQQRGKLRAAMANVRTMNTPLNEQQLTRVVHDITASADIRARIQINELAETIDSYSTQTEYYVTPWDKLREIVRNLRTIFANTDS